MIAGASRELAERLLGRELSTETAITADQTNVSVVVDDCVIVKWLRPPIRAPHPGVELIRHLAASGFEQMPALLGVDERDGVVHAIVTEYVRGAVDGWQWFADDVEAWLDGSVPFEALLSSAEQMGAVAVLMHRSLADMQPTDVELGPVAERAMADLDLAVDRLDDLHWLDRSAVARALQPLVVAQHAAGHRIHGDLHAGQFLRAGSTMLVTDFDGNPLHDSAERARPQSPVRDLASLIQSIVHVGAVVVKRRRPDRATEVDLFVDQAVQAALGEYVSGHPVDDDLLLAFRVAQELHEYAYAIHHLPHWRYVADDALPRLLSLR